MSNRKDRSGGVDLNSKGETNIGGDVAGRDIMKTVVNIIQGSGSVAIVALVALVTIFGIVALVISNNNSGAQGPPLSSATITFATPGATPNKTLVPQGVQTVRIEDPRATGPTRGFFTTRGYIIAFVNPDSTDVSVLWNRDGQEWQGQAQVVDRGGYVPEDIALLQLTDIDPPRVELPIRLSSSLKPQDFVERYITPHDRTSGTVLEVSVQREVKSGADQTVTVDRALTTTVIATFTDAGAPVLDSDGYVVGMVYGSSQRETVSIAIDWIKASFSQAFE